MAIDVDKLYRRYGPMVLRRCRKLLKDEETAREAMQDVFVQLLRKKDTLTDEYPSSLLYCMATNICLNLIRKNKKAAFCVEDEVLHQIADVDDPARKAVTRHFLDQLFEGEKASTRTMAVLHYVDGMTLEETARTTGLSVSGVRKRLRNLRAAGWELKEK